MRFGPIFTRRAEEPLGRAKTELGAGRVREALAALDPKALSASLSRALDDVGRAAGMPKPAVAALLDWGPIDMALASLGESRATAAAAWGELPQVSGGLLAGVAEVTTHAENDDVAFYLDRLGQKMQLDRSLAGPIDTLAADVEGWQALLAAAARTLDRHPRLVAARKRRRIIALVATLGAAAVIIPIAIAFAFRHRAETAAKGRVATALDDADPCVAERIVEADLEVAGPAAKLRASERTRACSEDRARAAHVAQCEALVSAVESRGTLEGDAAALAGPKRALFGRMIVRTLEPFDLEEVPTWPCAEVDGPARLWKVFIEAASTSTLIWRDPPPLADEVATRIADVGLTQASRGTLLAAAEEVAGRGVLQGDEASLRRGGRLCALCRQLKIETAGNCKGVEVVLAKTAGAAPP